MATLKITGVDEITAQFVDGRTKALHFKGRAEYLRNLIREDMARASSERESRLTSILAPLHEHSSERRYTDEYLAEIFERARIEVSGARNQSSNSRKKLPIDSGRTR